MNYREWVSMETSPPKNTWVHTARLGKTDDPDYIGTALFTGQPEADIYSHWKLIDGFEDLLYLGSAGMRFIWYPGIKAGKP